MQVEKTEHHTAAPPDGLVSLAACTMMFCLPWAGNVDLPMAGLVSLGFNIGAVGLIVLWMLTVRSPFRYLPRSYLVFILFFLVHTIIVHGLLFPSELFATSIVFVGIGVKEFSSPILLILRATLFFLTAFSVSALCRNKTILKNMAFALGISVLIILSLGGNNFHSTNGVRFSGGYANPNSFASVVVMMAYLVGFVIVDRKFSWIVRFAAGLMFLVAILIVLRTASRSAMVGLLGGSLSLLLWGDFKNSIFYVLALGGTVVLLFVFAPAGVVGYAISRFTSGESSGRPFIWASYLSQWREFIEYGVGFGREMTVLKSVSYHGIIWATHNTYLRVFVNFGIAGFLLFISSLGVFFSRIIQTQKRSQGSFGAKLLLAFFITILIQIFFGDYLVNRTFSLNLGIIGAYMGVYKRGDV